MVKGFLLSCALFAAGISAVTQAEGEAFSSNFLASAKTGFVSGDMSKFYDLMADEVTFDWSGGQKGEGKELLVKTMKASWEAMNSAFHTSDVLTVVDEHSGVVFLTFEVILNLNAHGKLPDCIASEFNLFEFKLNSDGKISQFRGVWNPRTFDTCFAAGGAPVPASPPHVITAAEGAALGDLLLSSFAANIARKNTKTAYSLFSDDVTFVMTPGESGSSIAALRKALSGWEMMVSKFMYSNVRHVVDSETGVIVTRFETTINLNKQGEVPSCFATVPNIWEFTVDANHVITSWRGSWNQNTPELGACMAKAMAEKKEL